MRRLVIGALLLAAASGPLSLDARPNRYGHSDREERHMFPAVSSGPKSTYPGDDYAFAQTSPVFLVRGGRRFIKTSDVQFLADTVDVIWARVERARWRSEAERQTFRAAIVRSVAFYRTLLKQESAGAPP